MRIRRATSANRTEVADLLRGLSAESAYRRFQTGLGPHPSARLLDALLPDGPYAGAVVADIGRSLVAHGMWHRIGTSQVAEIGLLVADGEQRRGIGTALAEVLLSDLTARGMEWVEIFATATNQAVARMVTRQAPGSVGEYDGGTVTYRLAVRPRVARSVA
jgi:GNAT superfamily N-acetyltransferase